jgi:hypothetical protein
MLGQLGLPNGVKSFMARSQICSKEGRKTGQKEAKRPESKGNRGKARQRRQEALLGEVSLPKEGDPNSDRSRGHAVNRPSEAAKLSGTPKRVIVHRLIVEAASLRAKRSSHESR